MGRGLYATENVFRETVDRCAKVIERRLHVNLAAGFHDPEAAERAQSNEFYSILTHGLLHIGLTALLKFKGIEPDGTIGLSLGEITSTVAAGALTPEDAIAVVQAAAQWDERLLDRGKLLLVDADLATAVALCRESPAPLEYFAEYGPTSAVLFCLASDVALISSFLRGHGIAHTVHRGDYAYHTPRFANCKDLMLAELAHLRPRPAQCQYYSSFASGLAPKTTFFDANYWYWMLAQPVWFNTAFEAALKDDYDVILNIGPHPSLEPYLRAAAKKAGKAPLFIDTLRDDEPEAATFSSALGTLREIGIGATRRPQEPANEAEDLDLGSEEAICDPYPLLAGLRSSGSVPFLRRHRYWLALAHDDVTAALNRPDDFSSDPARGLDPILLGADPDRHARARHILAPHFRAAQGPEFEAEIMAVTDACLEAAAASRTIDLVADFAVPISERVAARFIGLTDVETAALVALIGPDRWVLDYIPGLQAFFARYVRDAQSRPETSLLARMTSGPNDQRFDPDEAVSILTLMWIAGTTTTGMLVASAACTLLYQPAVRAEVAQHPDLVPALIEETMRLEAPEQTVWRRTRTSTSLGRTQLPPDAEVRLHLGAANRDPTRFAHADSFVLRRPKQPNLAFGGGIHQCIGAGLARLTCRIALERLLARHASIWPEKPFNELSYAASDHFRALRSLPARLKGIVG
jgi:cytochrome P450